MRIGKTLLILFLCHSVSYAQKLPSFGKIDKEELLNKECSYDINAEAECLYDYGEVNYFVNANSFTNERIVWNRVKIYNEKGLDRANIRIPYYAKGNHINIIKISGYTYNLNEKGEIEKTELEKDAIYKQKVDDTDDEFVFSLPKVKPGSVFEYRYTLIKKDVLELDGWVFQQTIPVRYSYYDVGIPGVLGFKFNIIARMPVEQKTDVGTLGARRRIFIMRNLPRLKSEPYMSSTKDYLQRVEFQLSGFNGMPLESATWKGFSNILLEDEDFGLQLRKNVLNDLDIAPKLKTLTDPLEKINLIYKFVQSKIAWNGYNSYWCSKGIKKAVDLHEGNSADINMLLINLLRDAGIDAKPILVSTRSHGKINMSFPFRRQFNNVYAYVDLPTGVLVMDATDKKTPFFITPWDVQFSTGFLVDKKMPQLVTIGDVKNKYRLTTIVQTELTEDGFIKGYAKSLALEYAKVERMQSIEKGKDDYKQKYYSGLHKEFTFDTLEVKNQDKDSLGLETAVNFKGELTKSGDYLLYNLNFLTGLIDNPFLAEERISTVEFGYNQSQIITGNIVFPESMVPEELPKNIKMITPDSSIIVQRMCQLDGNNISFRIVLQINRPLYFSDEYLDFKAFYAAMLETLNEQIVFRKKTRP